MGVSAVTLKPNGIGVLCSCLWDVCPFMRMFLVLLYILDVAAIASSGLRVAFLIMTPSDALMIDCLASLYTSKVSLHAGLEKSQW